MKLKIKRNLNHAPKIKKQKIIKTKNKNQPHASHISPVTTKNTSHATVQTMQEHLKVTYGVS